MVETGGGAARRRNSGHETTDNPPGSPSAGREPAIQSTLSSEELTMSDEIKVYVITKSGTPNLYLLAKDPVTGKRSERSARTADERKAREAAFKWQQELRDGTVAERVTWGAFKDRYVTEGLTGNAVATLAKVNAMFNAVEDVCEPRRLEQLNSQRIGQFTTSMLKRREVETVRSHLRHLKTALNWARDHELLARVPKIRMPKGEKGAKLMKGRPVTAEEFDRMLAKVESIVGKKADSWTWLLRGLWLSGLRLGEAMSLSWDRWSDGLTVDTSGEFVMLKIPAGREKGRRNRLLPVVPEFAEMLLSVPEDERTGFVFNPVPSRLKKHPRATDETASRTITRIGKAAGIVVDRCGDDVKHASAHDLRRGFGFRWSRRIMPAVLKELMRHADIKTTMDFYVGTEAEETARMLHRMMPVETLVESGSESATPSASIVPKTP
jgi:integrase